MSRASLLAPALLALVSVVSCATPAGTKECRPGFRVEQPKPGELRHCRQAGKECPGLTVHLECKL